MHSFFLPYKSSRIHYLKSGSGARCLICFHGYGESARSFGFLSASLDQDFTLFAVDLPFHGATQWCEGLDFTPLQLMDILEQILAEHGCQQRKVSLLGYSMGGRIALSIMNQFGLRLGCVVLLAPDGLRLNFWYWLTTQTWGGHRLFQLTMDHPGWFFALLGSANRMGLVNPSVYKFVSAYVDDQQAREQLYRCWTVMRKFRPDLAQVKSIVRTQSIPLSLLYGRHDRIIRHGRSEGFRRGIEPWCDLVVLDAGHQVLQEKNRDLILRALRR